MSKRAGSQAQRRDSDTADFISEVINRTSGGAIQSDKSLKDTKFSVQTPLVQNAHHEEAEPDSKDVFRTRLAVGLIGLLFIAGGVAALAELVAHLLFLQFLWPLVFGIAVSGTCLLVVQGGVCCSFAASNQKRRKVFAVAVVSGSAVLFALGIAGVALVSAVDLGDWYQSAIASQWNAAAQNHPSEVCRFQTTFRCEGWTMKCNDSSPVVITTTTFEPTSQTTTNVPTTTQLLPTTSSALSNGEQDQSFYGDNITTVPFTGSTTTNNISPPPTTTPTSVVPNQTTTTTELPTPAPTVEHFACVTCESSNQFRNTLCNDGVRLATKSYSGMTIPVLLVASVLMGVPSALIYRMLFKSKPLDDHEDPPEW